MTANAPYYQIRGHGFQPNVNGQAFGASEEDYDISSSLASGSAHLYPEGLPHTPDQQAAHNAQAVMDSSLEGNHNLVELLEAATTAAGQATEVVGHGRNISTQEEPAPSLNKGKRKRVSSPHLDEHGDMSTPNPFGESQSVQKRARHLETATTLTDPQLSQTIKQAHGSSDTPTTSSNSTDAPHDGRAVPVHSAAALFRRSSNQTAKKYTRPPMKQLFQSLQLTPENFLHLQAQAKAYMLDPTHPERQNCVGNRGKGDTDMVKLRLFNCVRDFLDAGAGAQFFGENVERPREEETIGAARALGETNTPTEVQLMIWPRDGNKIISLVTPLLRRMVTNERQRQYAIETRKTGSKKKESSVEAASVQANDFSVSTIEGNGSELDRLAHLDPALPSPPAPSQTQGLYSTYQTPNLPPSYPPGQVLEAPLRMEPYDLQMFEERALPERVPIFHTISIILTWRGAKLSPNYTLTSVASNYPFPVLQKEIRSVVRQALAIYPRLRPQRGMGPEALRGLAVAATEIDGAGECRKMPAEAKPVAPHDSRERNDRDPSPAPRPSPDNTTDTAANHADPHASAPQSPISNSPPKSRDQFGIAQSPASVFIPDLPRYVTKALMSRGLTAVESEADWEHAKSDVSFAAWAEGVMKVVVEFE